MANDADHQIWRRYGVQAWPTRVIIDPAGNLVGTAMGEGGPPATVVRAGSVEPRAPVASFRLTKQAAAPLSLNHATEGRQTL